MGKFSRDKGYRVENNLRKQILTHEKMECIRVPLSGGASIKGDLIFNKKGGEKWQAEVKARADGFKNIYKWLTDVEILILKADNKKALAVLDLDDLLTLIEEQK
ncbi:hypothetical protein [Hyphomonas sp.]|uniref:hypothetical protein n=1 Tax=Hyphomonas sp. TaxID=87 RepID=UPI000C92A9AA|nr:hypothetical protein [Hyphomonas sp.]MAL46656.1 hypothetical protein [Hyphomonas sp.]